MYIVCGICILFMYLPVVICLVLHSSKAKSGHCLLPGTEWVQYYYNECWVVLWSHSDDRIAITRVPPSAHIQHFTHNKCTHSYTHIYRWIEDYDQYEYRAAFWNNNCQSMKGPCCSFLFSLISLSCITVPISEQHYFLLRGFILDWKL